VVPTPTSNRLCKSTNDCTFLASVIYEPLCSLTCLKFLTKLTVIFVFILHFMHLALNLSCILPKIHPFLQSIFDEFIFLKSRNSICIISMRISSLTSCLYQDLSSVFTIYFIKADLIKVETVLKIRLCPDETLTLIHILYLASARSVNLYLHHTIYEKQSISRLILYFSLNILRFHHCHLAIVQVVAASKLSTFPCCPFSP
jgi:hypothetical protein